MTPNQLISASGESTPSATLNVGGETVKEIEYNMRPFFEQCVDSYLELSNKSRADPKPAKTPLLDESKLE